MVNVVVAIVQGNILVCLALALLCRSSMQVDNIAGLAKMPTGRLDDWWMTLQTKQTTLRISGDSVGRRFQIMLI